MVDAMAHGLMREWILLYRRLHSIPDPLLYFPGHKSGPRVLFACTSICLPGIDRSSRSIQASQRLQTVAVQAIGSGSTSASGFRTVKASPDSTMASPIGEPSRLALL